MTYNLPLRPAWEAEENYNFKTFHKPGCDQKKCNGTCGQENKGKLWEQISLRKATDRARKKQQAAEMSGKNEGSGTPEVEEKLEEPGDDDFVLGTKNPLNKGGDMPKGRKKGRVTFVVPPK